MNPVTNNTFDMGYTCKRCRCSVCGEWFSTTSNFDKHRKGQHGQRYCVDPATVGLVIRKNVTGDMWSMPPRKENLAATVRQNQTIDLM